MVERKIRGVRRKGKSQKREKGKESVRGEMKMDTTYDRENIKRNYLKKKEEEEARAEKGRTGVEKNGNVLCTIKVSNII